MTVVVDVRLFLRMGIAFLRVCALLEAGDRGGRDDDGARARALDEQIDEGVVPSAVLDHEVSAGDRELVLRARLVAVRVLRGRVDDARDGGEVARDGGGDVAVDVGRGDDRQSLGLRGRCGAAGHGGTGSDGDQQRGNGSG